MRAYAAQHMAATNALLAEAARDENAPATVRMNALVLLAQRKAGSELSVFRGALDDQDVRVRATATAAMREFLPAFPDEAVRIARMALADTSQLVQAQALQILGAADVELVRAYLARTTDPELRRLAGELVQVAEERGAPLPGDSATGELRRVTSHGYNVTFTPRQHWPQWRAGYGDVRIERPGGAPIVLTDIEAVAGVVPVFFSPPGDRLVYEKQRTIIVRSLSDGSERSLGPGIAPRTLPFSEDFVFLREQPGGRSEERERTRIRYDVLRAPFGASAGAPTVLGDVTLTTIHSTHGSYSPARWLRVEDRGGNFYLLVEGVEPFALPSPFAPAGVDG
jgi:hypothetical protein